MATPGLRVSRDLYDTANATYFAYQTQPGINEKIVRDISAYKKEPEWILAKRLQGLKYFHERPMPVWGPDLSALQLEEIVYYTDPGQAQVADWDSVPAAIVDFLPELAIKTNDVKCSHGITMTHLDDAALFYLRSRGLAVPTARQLATRGFFHHQLTLPPKVAALLEDVITTHMAQST